MDARILLLSLAAGLLEAHLAVAAPASGTSDLAWAVAAGYGLAVAGTLAAYLAGVPRQALGRRALCGGVVGMLAQAFASAWAMAWSSMNAMATPGWLLAAAPLLGAIGALLGSFLEGVRMDPPARLTGWWMDHPARLNGRVMEKRT